MTQEEKAKAYDEAIERAKNFIENGDERERTIAESIFAGIMEESEDEKIRKSLINGFNKLDKSAVWYNGITNDQILAWLEKQGENDRNMKFVTDDAYQRGYDEGIKVTLEKKCEQKPVPDWMPKFLDELRSKKNYFDWDEDKDIEGGILAIINWMNPNYFNEKDDEQKPQGKSALEAAKEEKVDNQNCVKPIDKVEPKFKVGDKIVSAFNTPYYITKVCDRYYLTDVGRIIMFNAQDNFELAEQNPAWSEKDEVALGDALWCCKQAASIAKDENDMGNVWCAEHWLKSLKDRFTWKPSDEQMNALDDVISSRDIKYDILSELWKDLKKLREE